MADMLNRFVTLLFLIATPSLASASSITFDAPSFYASPIDVLSFTRGAILGGGDAWTITVAEGIYSPKFEQAVASGMHFADATLNLLNNSFVSETEALTDIVFTSFVSSGGGTIDTIGFTDKTSTLTVSAPTLTIPGLSTAIIGVPYGLTATLLDGNGEPIIGDTVDFLVQSGPDAGATGAADTNGQGLATFSYTGTAPGSDIVLASFILPSGSVLDSNSGEVDWSATAPVPVPEPATLTLTALGCAGLFRRYHRRRSR